MYDLKSESRGLAVFIVFETSKQVVSQSRIIYKQIQECLVNFRFDCQYIRSDTRNVKQFSKQFETTLSTVHSQDYNCLITFLIGDVAPVKYSNYKLSYIINSDNTSYEVISHQDIETMIYESLSQLPNTVPAIVFHSGISQNNPTLPPDWYNLENTFLCYVSNHHQSLPQGIDHHQLIYSLNEVLKDSPNESMFLVELITQVRDNYFKYFPATVRGTYNKDTVFYSTNTIRYPLLIKNSQLNSEHAVDSSEQPIGIFFVINSSEIYENRWAPIVAQFESMNFVIGEHITINCDQKYSESLECNRNIGHNCRFVFVLVISTVNSAEDELGIDVATFSQQLSITFPKIPKVIFFSQVTESIASVKTSTKFEHMVVVHSIESDLSNSSLIKNFTMEIKNNYFAEIHTILRSSILNSTQSNHIQVVDGFRKDFYINYHGHIAQLLNTESDEFSKAYEKACFEGSESFKFYRLMIVGPEGVGKTSLLRVLTGKTFQQQEKTTQFLNKYNLQIQKLSKDWTQIEKLGSYIQNFEETIQDVAMKSVAQMTFKPQDTKHNSTFSPHTIRKETELSKVGPTSHKEEYFVPKTEFMTYESEELPAKSHLYPIREESTASIAKRVAKVSPNSELSSSLKFQSEKKTDSTPHEKISSSLDRIQYLGSKTDFFSAWDFAGQNYLYCFHSLFLSPRSVYLLLIDLTIEDLEKEVNPCYREDRHGLRSQSGVPRTYLEVYEFWLNAIYSVSKTVTLADSYNSSAKIILVFSKADEVVNPKEVARQHLETIKSHMCKKNNAFELVHEEDELFIISCKTNSPYFDNLSKLKSTITRISDQVAFEEPTPIRWLKLANDILKEKQPILDRSRIENLAKGCNCSSDLDHFLYFFHEIGFFFYKEETIIIDIQIFLDIIYQLLSPTAERSSENSFNIDTNVFNKEGKLFFKEFDQIIERMKLDPLKESILELLQLYGIVIPCKLQNEGENFYYIPYLLKGSLQELKKQLPSHTLKTKFFAYFPDGFLPASLYFTLIAKCMERSEKKEVPQETLGFDCSIFYVNKLILVSLDYSTDRSYIIISFFTIDSNSIEEEYINLKIVHYLTFLQVSLVRIQTALIPCGNLAKLMFVCDSCKTLSLLKKGQKPNCSLDTVFSLDPTFEKICCTNQLKQLNEYISTKDPISHQYEYTMLARFILNNITKVVKYLNWKLWRELSNTLYSYGLISIQTLLMIESENKFSKSLLEEFFIEMVHKSPSWANVFLNALHRHSKHEEISYLYNFIEKEGIPRKTEVTPKTEEPSKNSNPSPIYQMKRSPHGIAFIVNIENYENELKKREGSKHDVASLWSMFNFLQYDTRVYEDLTRTQYLRAQNYIRALNKPETYDSFFCVIMAHGNENGEVIFSNGKSLRKDKIVAEFSPKYCEQLKEKPKIFIFQACRGTTGQSIRTQTDAGPVDKNLLADYLKSPTNKICTDSTPTHGQKSLCTPCCDLMDTFIGDSTVDQYVSYREPTRGTFFIQSFCNVMQSCSDKEFTHIMMEVRRDVSLKSNQLIQCTEDTNRLLGPVYF